MNAEQKQGLLDLLFDPSDPSDTSLFALLDAARDPEVFRLLEGSGLEYECLFTGQLDPALRAAAPYLVRLVPKSELCQHLLDEGWGRAWGLYLASQADFRQVRRHLRTFLRVQTEERKKLFFRYYDPRVLRSFLPTCTSAQLEQIFGPILRFDMESPDSKQLLRFKIAAETPTSFALKRWSYALPCLEVEREAGRPA